MHRSAKPVRRCNGCGLNLKDHCGVYDNPHNQWHRRGQCPGYMNEKMLAEYQQHIAASHNKAKKERRKEVAKANGSEPHHDGDRHTRIVAGS